MSDSESSSDLGSIVLSILENNYTTVAVLTAIGYDYILTIPYEVEYIWNKRWTWVSTLFLLIRYVGLCAVMIYILVGSSFVPGPEKNIRTAVSKLLTIIGTWQTCAFLAAADLMMILRVWALYARSKIILGVLLTVYALEVALFIVSCSHFSTPGGNSVVLAQVLDFSFCTSGTGGSSATGMNSSIQFALSTILVLFVAARFFRQSFQLYKATNEWQPNRYMNLFIREGVFYFLAVLSYGFMSILVFGFNVSPTGWRIIVMGILQYVPVFTLTPRFILNMRALYERDHGLYVSGSIDSAFGFTTETMPGARTNTEIVFADLGQSVEGMHGDEMELKGMGKR